ACWYIGCRLIHLRVEPDCVAVCPTAGSDHQLKALGPRDISAEFAWWLARHDVGSQGYLTPISEHSEIGVGDACIHVVVDRHLAAEAGESSANAEEQACWRVGAQGMLVSLVLHYHPLPLVSQAAMHAQFAIADADSER